ncbi:UDP-glucose 4-epimerase [Vanrija pseudolonga]|uniref:UDP-glucose 4-epimerase n=1 Tax=Vanrija pseudolonga TaxID=143232 RepID=A0AAF0Y180_9TREE|nr:UDP-glucose 4-epimerase [Vanrija pseudolonga]
MTTDTPTHAKPQLTLLTGACGLVGSRTLQHLHAKGFNLVATDIVPPKEGTLPPGIPFIQADLTKPEDVDKLFDYPGPTPSANAPPPAYDFAMSHTSNAEHRPTAFDAVVHISAIAWLPAGKTLDARTWHANNVVGSYNVVRTAAERGVRNIVQASSMNAQGVSYTIPGRNTFDGFPMSEGTTRRPMDPYGLSKHEAEIQADSVAFLCPWTRIATLRYHFVTESYETAWPLITARDVFSWVSYDACARAAECALTAPPGAFTGHEIFHIVAPEIAWEGGLEEVERRKVGDAVGERPGTVDLLRRYWPGIRIDEAYWASNPRRAVWMSDKAERVLGWKHDG